jgi:4-amino-4-deoxy-L-arabinose transferase-like glycosyltransferase
MTTDTAFDPRASEIESTPRRGVEPRWRGWLLALLSAGIFFAIGLAGLSRLPFHDGVEHINLASVQETFRETDGLARTLPGSIDDPPIVGTHPWGERVNDRGWLIPTLQGQPRLVKPPLTAWITAAGIRTATICDLSHPDSAVRRDAMTRFLFESRWTSILCAALMLLAVYDLGKTCGASIIEGPAALPRSRLGVKTGTSLRTHFGWQAGLVAVLICASTLLFLRQGRRATTDLQLALWVTVGNALLARMVLRRQLWLGAVAGGTAVGLAAMSKGPHIALLQTAVPVFLFIAWIGWKRRGTTDMRSAEPRPPRLAAPVMAGVILMLAVGLWWYVLVLIAVPGVSKIWWSEVTRVDANLAGMKPDKWHQYLSFFPLMRPWTAWLILGMAMALRDGPGWRRNQEAGEPERKPGEPERKPGGGMLCLFLLLVPIVVMSFFSERKERYLLPMIAPAAVLAAIAVVRFLAAAGNVPAASRGPWLWDDRRLGWIAAAITGALVGWLVIGVPIAGAMNLTSYQTWDGRPWFTWRLAALVAGTGLLLLIGAAAAWRKWKPAPIVATVLSAWIGFEVWTAGYVSDDNSDSRPHERLADAIWQQYPDAVIHSARSPTEYGRLSMPTFVLSIRLNRRCYPAPDPLPGEPRPEPRVLLRDAALASDPAPPAPKGWQRLAAVPMRKGMRYVDVLPAAGNGPR